MTARRRTKLLWQLYPSYLLILLPALLAAALYASIETRNIYLDEKARDLEARARLMDRLLSEGTALDDAPAVTAVCVELGEATHTRYTVILPDGTVTGDSERDPATMDDHGDRPELREAWKTGLGIAVRHSDTLEQDMMYAAVPATRDGEEAGIVRASVPVAKLTARLSSLYVRIGVSGLLVAMLAAAISFWVAHRIREPLRRMKEGAARFADGDLDYRLEVPDAEETAALAHSMNQMAEQLSERIRFITRQRNELEAVLASMIEAVLVVDTEARLVRFNDAATRLFNIEPGRAEGLSIQEVVHNADLNRFVEKVLEVKTPIEDSVMLTRGEETYLSAQGTALKDAGGHLIGALVVMHDITALKKLERIRKDFVANVSHELKTPITSIQGFVETLKDGAMEDEENAHRFLDIIARHADRLNKIIEDLLSLSRIEQQGEAGQIPLEHGRVRPVLEAAADICRTKADEKKIRINLECAEGIEALLNPALLEQAVVDLVDNAIKYSDPDGEVWVRAERDMRAVVIEVEDGGCGIPREHLPRLFERFYRVDKARSRAVGGTGLGLAIVKHIAVAHQGRVSVESSQGEGSTFRIHLRS